MQVNVEKINIINTFSPPSLFVDFHKETYLIIVCPGLGLGMLSLNSLVFSLFGKVEHTFNMGV